MQKVAIIGAGGFAREVLDVFEAVNAAEPRFEVLGWLVDARYAKAGDVVNDLPVLGGLDWLERRAHEVHVLCGVGAPQDRRRLVGRAAALGARFCSAVHPSAILTRRVTLGEGVVVAAGCIFTNQIRVGDHVHVNLDCTVGHDAVLGDYATLAPGVHVSGGVTFEEGAYAGTGAVVIDDVCVGAWSVVGAGTVLIRDVAPNTTVVGSPGRVVDEREAGWHLA